MATTNLNIIFVINKNAGDQKNDPAKEILQWLKDRPTLQYRIFELKEGCSEEAFIEMIRTFRPDIVVAVGGDGTIKFVADHLTGSDIAVGVIPAGSANGLATELNIPTNVTEALELIVNRPARQIHLLKINDTRCIHLSDIGFNAHTVKKFGAMNRRGMISYLRAAWRVLWVFQRMKVSLELDNDTLLRSAIMIVLANGRKYGTGIAINPEGSLEDDEFEIVVVRKISLIELIKMTFTRQPLNPKKTEILKAKSVRLQTRRKAHFQIDGEYMGKTAIVQAELLPRALRMIFES